MSDEQIALLIKHELAIRQLYNVYAEKFPEYGDFWRQLASEEAAHAGWLKGIADKSAYRQPFRRHSDRPCRIPSRTYALRVISVTREGWSRASNPRTTVSSSSRSPRICGSMSSATSRSDPSGVRSTNRHRPGSSVSVDSEHST